jgi:hypothetical protein
MANNGAHDTATTEPLDRATPDVSLSVTAVAAVSGLSGFTAETGFTVSDNGDGTLKVADAQTRLGAKPNASKPVYFFDFGSGSDQPHATLSRLQTTVAWKAASFIGTEVVKAGSTNCMTVDTSAAFDSGSVFSGEADRTLVLPANSGRKYFRYYDVYNDFTETELMDSVVANSDVSQPNFKTQRWMSDGQQSLPYTPNVLQATSYRFLFSGDGADQYGTVMYSRSELSTKKWRTEEEYHEVLRRQRRQMQICFLSLMARELLIAST